MHNKLPTKYYFIDNFDKNKIDKQDINTAIIFRNYKKKINKNQLYNFRNYCKKKGHKIFISNNVRLAINLNFDGVYLPSFNNNFRHLNYLFKKKFLIIGSSHNIKEIKIKENQKVKVIFLSSIFKKNKNFLGINKFKILSNHTDLKIIALGGISKDNLEKLNLLNCYGFAGISYFS